MKKSKEILYWIISIVPFIVTAAFMPFLDSQIPIHYDSSGNVDDYGSKYTYFIIAGIMFVAIFCMGIMVMYYYKKNYEDDEKRKKSQSNANVIYFIGIVMALFESVIISILLYSAYLEGKTGSAKEKIDILKVVVIALGVVFILLGNYMPKTRRNSLVGIRTSWSQKNDKTWAVSNRMGGILLMIDGIFSIVVGFVLGGNKVIFACLAGIVFFTIIAVAYSYVAYKKYGDTD